MAIEVITKNNWFQKLYMKYDGVHEVIPVIGVKNKPTGSTMGLAFADLETLREAAEFLTKAVQKLEQETDQKEEAKIMNRTLQ